MVSTDVAGSVFVLSDKHVIVANFAYNVLQTVLEKPAEMTDAEEAAGLAPAHKCAIVKQELVKVVWMGVQENKSVLI